jgi:hypothetical protein
MIPVLLHVYFLAAVMFKLPLPNRDTGIRMDTKTDGKDLTSMTLR